MHVCLHAKWILAAICVSFLNQPSQGRVFDLQTATVLDIQAAMDSGALTSEQLVSLYLQRIEAYNAQGPSIQAIITLNEAALAEARRLDAERRETGPRSLLHGVPIALKDLINTTDLPTSAGFIHLKDSYPAVDAAVVQRLRSAGAIVMIKANMSDWFGVADRAAGHQSTVLKERTLNPYNLDRIPGGSSGGSGAAVAAVFAQIGLGTETGVSIRNPTSNNSLAGLAPSRGLIPRTGMTMTSFQQERVGPMARSVTDVAVAAEVMAGFDAGDLLTVASLSKFKPGSYTEALKKDGLKGARIGVFRDLFRKGSAHEEGNALIEAAVALMREEGATIIDPVSTGLDLVSLFPEMRTNYWEGPFSYDLYFRELGPNAAIRDTDHLIEIGGELVKPTIIRARQEFDRLDGHKEYLARLKTQEMVLEAILEVMDRYKLDALVHPFKSVPPERFGERQDEKDNPVSSITGLPALLVPAGYTSAENGPIAIEFLGRPFSEPVLFQLAYGYEQASQMRKPAPTVPPLEGEKIRF